jgi:hypothetical protein
MPFRARLDHRAVSRIFSSQLPDDGDSEDHVNTMVAPAGTLLLSAIVSGLAALVRAKYSS